MEVNEELIEFLWNMSDTTINNDQYNDYPFNPDLLLDDLRSNLYRHKEPFNIVLMVVYAITMLAGLVGNAFVILVVVRQRHMRTLTNVFFLNLTIGDLLVLIICIPITLGNYLYRDWVYGEIMCKVTPFLQGTAVSVSVFSMLAISINRYFAIHIPLKAKLIFSRQNVAIIIVLIWIASFGAISPLLFVNNVTTYGVPGIFEARACEEKWGTPQVKQIYSLVMLGILFVSPLSGMATMYSIISTTLWNADTQLYPNGTKTGKVQTDRVIRQRRKTVRTLISLVIIFGVCWLPYYVVNIWLDFNIQSPSANDVLNYVYPLVQLLALSNSTVNPICYCFLTNGFRRAFINICCRKKRRTNHGTIVTVRYKCPLSDDSAFESVETVLS
ncbi:hypothetical protein SNE40_017326 [Patella caerulea]|uniref:G-protein coupled receptors family 1 profile domain-containing protein n=1 Tax=Patella caerulea TaxID=87958 RepID=A0AAN8JEU3_PATCE